MTATVEIVVTPKEASSLQKLGKALYDINTIVGMYQCFLILGPTRARQILEAAGKGQEVKFRVAKIMACGRCNFMESVDPIQLGETTPILWDADYRCFACRKIEEAGL